MNSYNNDNDNKINNNNNNININLEDKKDYIEISLDEIIDSTLVTPKNEDNYENQLNNNKSNSLSLYSDINSYSAVIEILVPIKEKDFFTKDWANRIYNKVSTYKGFKNRHIHLIDEVNGYCEFLIVLVFDTYDSFMCWQLSEDRNEHVDELKKHGIRSSLMNAYGGDGEHHKHTITSNNLNNNNNELINTRRITVQNMHAKHIPRPMPPPKWKLVIILICTVYWSLLVIQQGTLSIVLIKENQPIGFTLLINIIIIVLIMTYASLPLTMSIPFIDKWLRCPRHLPIEDMHPLHCLIDQGLLIFSEKTHQFTIPQDLLDRISKLEGKCDKLRDVNHTLRLKLQTIENKCDHLNITTNNITNNNTNNTNNNDSFFINPAINEMIKNNKADTVTNDNIINAIAKEVDRNNNNNVTKTDSLNHMKTPITMAVKHYVKWECVLDFEKWTDEIDTEMSKHKGYMGMVRIAPKPGETIYINSFTFDTFENLYSFSKSTVRNELLKKLEPMLEGVSSYQLNEERVYSNAWSELFVSTGGTVPNRPPPLWKSCILTICPLFIVVFQLGFPLTKYLIEAQYNPYLITFITTCVNVIIVSYFGVPTMYMFFGKWLNMPRIQKDKKFAHLKYFEFFDIGIPKYAQIGIVIIFILANVLS